MRKMIRSVKEAYDYVSDFGLQEERKHRMIIVYMKEDGEVLGWNERKGYTVTEIDGATHAIVVTNHPSGNSLPDKYDIQETITVKELLGAKGIGLVDQLIVGYREFYSYANESITVVK